MKDEDARFIADAMDSCDPLRHGFVKTMEERNQAIERMLVAENERDYAVQKLDELVGTAEKLMAELRYLRGVFGTAKAFVDLINAVFLKDPSQLQIIVPDPGLLQVVRARIANIENAIHKLPLIAELPLELSTTFSPSKLTH